jgi:predicted RNA binding protein YcfA (HicA-like mRNA interferase family)
VSERLPALRSADVITALEKAGWSVARQRGSHVSMVKQGAPYVVTVPQHRRDLPRGTLRGIINDAGLTVEEFIALL